MKMEIRTGLPDLASMWEVFLSAGRNGDYNLSEEEYYSAAAEGRYIACEYSEGSSLDLEERLQTVKPKRRYMT